MDKKYMWFIGGVIVGNFILPRVIAAVKTAKA